MNRVLACLQGGLGNQCFIYAAARAAAIKARAAFALNLDYLAEDKVYRRKYALGAFACAVDVCGLSVKAVRIFRKVRYALLRDRVHGVGNWRCDKRPYAYHALPSRWRGTLTLDGYWQSEKYFHDVREQLLQDFRLKDDGWLADDPAARQIRAAEDSVFVHVRSYKEVPGREDGSCAKSMAEYYRKSIAYVKERVARPKFFVFSDDAGLARELIADAAGTDARDFTFVGECRDVRASGQIRDFTLMRLCRHGIVADSSFSWWAGWLGEQERLLNGEKPLRLRVGKVVMNADFWPDRWIAVKV